MGAAVYMSIAGRKSDRQGANSAGRVKESKRGNNLQNRLGRKARGNLKPVVPGGFELPCDEGQASVMEHGVIEYEGISLDFQAQNQDVASRLFAKYLETQSIAWRYRFQID